MTTKRDECEYRQHLKHREEAASGIERQTAEIADLKRQLEAALTTKLSPISSKLVVDDHVAEITDAMVDAGCKAVWPGKMVGWDNERLVRTIIEAAIGAKG